MAHPKKLKFLGDDGLQGCLGTIYSPQRCLKELTQIKRVWDDDFSVVLTADALGDNCCALQCKHCSSNFSPSNSAAATKGHLKRCYRYIKQQQPRRSPKGHAGSKGSLTLQHAQLAGPSSGREAHLRQGQLRSHAARRRRACGTRRLH